MDDDARKMVGETVPVALEDDVEEVELPLDHAIQALQHAMAAIPVEHRGTAVFRVTSGYDTSWIRFEVAYKRPQTDEEAERERLFDARLEAEREAMDRRLYEKLKARFG